MAATMASANAGQARAPEVRPGVLGGLGDAGLDLVVGDQALHVEPGEQRLLGPQVVVLQVHGGQAGVGPLEAVALAVAVEQPVLGDPVELVGQRHGVGLEGGEHRLPAAQDVGADLLADDGQALGLGVLAGPVEQLPLDVEGGDGRAVLQLEGLAQGQVVGDLAQGRAPARAKRRSRGRTSSSIMARTMAVVPTLRKVATSDRLASPMMTWSRR